MEGVKRIPFACHLCLDAVLPSPPQPPLTQHRGLQLMQRLPGP